MFVPQFVCIKLLFVFCFEDLLESIFEETIISFENGILGTELDGHFPHKRVGEDLVREVSNGFMGVVHSHADTAFTREIEDFSDNRFASGVGSEDELKLSGSGELDILTFVLVTIRVSSNDEGLLPAWDESGNVFADDGFSEDGSV